MVLGEVCGGLVRFVVVCGNSMVPHNRCDKQNIGFYSYQVLDL